MTAKNFSTLIPQLMRDKIVFIDSEKYSATIFHRSHDKATRNVFTLFDKLIAFQTETSFQNILGCFCQAHCCQGSQ